MHGEVFTKIPKKKDFNKQNYMDSKILQRFKIRDIPKIPHFHTFIDIVSYLNAKLPIPLRRVYGLANRCASHAELEDILYRYASPNTALNMKQVCKIVYFYFRDRPLHCK